jgi:AraC-like DNA-binding protein
MLPDVKYIRPGADITWLVNQFEAIHYNSCNKLSDKFVPREDASLVFHFGNPPRMLSPVNQLLPRFFIAPLSPTANSIMIEGETDIFIVTCKPTVLSRILGISMIPGKEAFIPLPEQIFKKVWEVMKKHCCHERRIKAFSRFIGEISPGEYVPDETDKMYEKILTGNFSAPVHEIIREFNVSVRTIQRRFRERLGITPKMLSRIIKINFNWNSINVDETIDYQDLVFMGNYFDQTHFIKDFKALTGETPDHFFRRNLHVAKILSGREP